MNYLSHGYRFLDRPLFMAGTVVPDWLSVVNRKVRARSRLVKPVVESTSDDAVREVGLGILQHHHDDAVFHSNPTFLELEGVLGAEFRTIMPDKFDHRPGFLGHIVVELMLDAVLTENDPALLDGFYATMRSVDSQKVESAVNQMATRTTDRLAWFIDRFCEEKFLYDYATDEGMFFRLNQVLKRVSLPPMPSSGLQVLAKARHLMRHQAEVLLAFVAAADQDSTD